MPPRAADRRAAALRNLLLVVVTDRKRCRGDLVASCEAAVRGGATAILLRDRDLPRARRRALARRLKSITVRYNATLLVHGDAALAREVDADGVHLDSKAGPAEVAGVRRVVGRGRVVGISAHSETGVKAAHGSRADYTFLGPVFPSRSHPGHPGMGWDGFVAAQGDSVAIGGIRPDRVRSLREGTRARYLRSHGTWTCGTVHRVAAIDALLGVPDPEAAAGRMLAALASDWIRQGRDIGGGGDERSLVGGFLRAMGRNPDLALGPGDDAVVLKQGGIAIATDLTVEGVHYEAGTPPRAAGFKAAGRALSDLAAVGAEPVGLMVGFAVRRGLGAASRVRGIENGVAAAAAAVGTRILGGDTKETQGTETISITAVGRVKGPPPLPRSGGRPGDVLFVTGPLGGSIRGRHLRPRPRIDIGLALRRGGLATACIDLSDGLAGDLHKVCRASGCGALLDGARIPVHPDVRRPLQRMPIDHALLDGEDHELLFAVPREKAASVASRGVAGHGVFRIGRLVHRAAGVVVQSHAASAVPDAGWTHFRERDR